MKLNYPEGSTPLDRNEIAGLLRPDITTQGELNHAEQSNIIEASKWAMGKKHSRILTEKFILELHKRMFNNVWKWAGKVRTSDKNPSFAYWENIREELQKLLIDTHYWIEHQTYAWKELAARFHHRLVKIHVFANGNGRHARLMTDVLLVHFQQERFNWGNSHSENLTKPGEARLAYITALRLADEKDYSKLIEFVHS